MPKKKAVSNPNRVKVGPREYESALDWMAERKFIQSKSEKEVNRLYGQKQGWKKSSKKGK